MSGASSVSRISGSPPRRKLWMSLLRLLLNILWILTGLWMVVAWLVAAMLMAIILIGLPWARAAFNIAAFQYASGSYAHQLSSELSSAAC